ncbi:MAG: transglycosylase domain-containing protein [Actinomycetota bacterium]|nr:transglycosylase domain-containing protein [Actinomycetota bacterium]
MSDDRIDIPPEGDESESMAAIPFPDMAGGPPTDDAGRPRRPRVNRVRLALIFVPLAMLAVISTVFGMMMAVASDLPQLENKREFKGARKSTLLDYQGRPLAILADNKNHILASASQISAAMQHAIVSVEDQRFYENQGIDVRGMGRALVADVKGGGGVQGGSTITQQFVKNQLQAQNNRTIFEKLREAALAYHLTRKWTKRKILTEYLNAVYFGNGAYGIESAARVYFGRELNCGVNPDDHCASQLTPGQGALLAGMVASPVGYDPVVHPQATTQRRNFVLQKMLAQGYITRSEFAQDSHLALPTKDTIQPPTESVTEPSAGYFVSWVRQQVVDHFHGGAFIGGLKIKTTLDLDLQRAAVGAVQSRFSDPSGPTASLVAIDNKTGEVRAMVGGRDFRKSPFNLATQGQRQPGSSFKAFVLAAALKKGISPDSVWASQRKEFPVPHGNGEVFQVNNYEGEYVGSRSLTDAIAQSDNSVFAEVGIKTGTNNVARTAHRLGIRTPISRNYAMTLGGLKEGVTPLDMAHAYETLSQDGNKVVNPALGAEHDGPIGIHEVRDHQDHVIATNQPQKKRVLPKDIAQTETQMLSGVMTNGTGTSAAIGGFEAGKTGTTENSGDAWFVGYTHKYTVAVWVGYPERLKPMLTEFGGDPVTGKTFPAEIWHDFMTSARDIDSQRASKKADEKSQRDALAHPDRTSTGSSSDSSGSTSTGEAPASRAPAAPDKSSAPSPSGGGGSTGGPSGGGSGDSGGGGGASPAPAAPSGPGDSGGAAAPGSGGSP